MIHERFLPRLWSMASPIQGLRGEGDRYLRFFGSSESGSGLHRIKLVFYSCSDMWSGWAG